MGTYVCELASSVDVLVIPEACQVDGQSNIDDTWIADVLSFTKPLP